MLSTGEHLDAFNTGKKVPTKAIIIDVNNKNNTLINLKFKKEILTTEATAIVLITEQATTLKIADNTKQIVVIIKASVMKILNTSPPLAPTARRIPISFFLFSIATDMKL